MRLLSVGSSPGAVEIWTWSLWARWELKIMVWESDTEWWVVRTKEISWLFSRQIESRRESRISKMLGTFHILNLNIKSCWFMHLSPPPLLSSWSRPPPSLTLTAAISPDLVLPTTLASLQSSLYIVSRVSLPKGKYNPVSSLLKSFSYSPHVQIEIHIPNMAYKALWELDSVC